MFEYYSSSVDWCESNHLFSNYICEFFNSWSSLSYILLTLYHIKYILPKIKIKYNEYIFLFFINTCIGISSFYFHATLSYSGQILDEGFIFVFIILISKIFTNDTKSFFIFLSSFILILIFLPFYTRFLLFNFGIYQIYKLYQIQNMNPILKHGFGVSLSYFILSIFFWVFDFIYCDYLYFSLHWLWHILSSIALHNLILTSIITHNHHLTLNKTYGFLKIKKKEII